MKNSIFFYAIFCLGSTLKSQDTTISRISSVQFPFRIGIKSLEECANQVIKGIIYKDSLYTDDHNDQLKSIVWKDGNIRFSPVQNNVLKIDIPLKVWIEKGIGALGAYTYKNIEFKLIMSFHLVYSISPEWKLKTKTLKNGYIWVQKPSLNFGTIHVPITPLVERILDKKQSEYATLIDGQISKSIDLKANMMDVWNTMKVPQKVSEEYNTWLAIIPYQVEAKPFVQDDRYIQSAFKLDVAILSSIGSDSSLRTPTVKDIPNFSYQNFQTDSFRLLTFVTLPYSELNQIAQKKFINQEYSFQEGKYRIRMNTISLSSNLDKLMIESDLTGSFNGKVRILGEVYFNETNRTIRLRQLEFDLKTKNILHKVANWLFNRKIERNLEDNFEMPIGDILDYCHTNTNKTLNRRQNGFSTSGKIWYIAPIGFKCDTNQLLLTLETRGLFSIEK